jgi:hypothetical protein
MVIEEAFATTAGGGVERLIARLKRAERRNARGMLAYRLKSLSTDGFHGDEHFVTELADDIYRLEADGLRLLFYPSPAGAPCTGIRVTNGYIGDGRNVRKHVERAIRMREEDKEK